MGASKLGLGPQQREPTVTWPAQKLRKVTITLCSALIRPHQESLGEAAETLFTGVHSRRAGNNKHKWKQEAQNWISGKTFLPGAGCQSRLCRLHPGRCQAPTGHSLEQPDLGWGWPCPEQGDHTRDLLRCCSVWIVLCSYDLCLCLRSAYLLSPIYKLQFSSHLFHFPLTLFNQQTVLLCWSFMWTPLAAGVCVAEKEPPYRDATRSQIIQQEFHQERSKEGTTGQQGF